MKRITIDDVARKSGVSKETILAVINAEDSVRPQTRELVLDVMRSLNYHPRGLARNLKRDAHDRSIGIIIKDFSYPFYQSIVTGVKEYADTRGYSVIVTSSEDNHRSEERLTHLFSENDVKGTIIAPTLEGESEIEHLFKLKRLNYPFVLLEDVKGIQANVVAIDNLKAIKKVVTYLINSGHTKIVHFAGPQHSSHTQERIDGFRHAFSESALVFRDDVIVPMGSHFEECFSRAKKYFRSRQKQEHPTAIVCFNDQQAFAVITALRELSIRVPDDVSVIGNDDISYASMCSVPLTTVRAPQHEIGVKAAEILIRHIESPSLLPPERVILETELVLRGSSKAMNN
ncbi:MAG: LacI family DNA-binding transcriptional regulator [Ignavibacteria bacterium]|nr:LacI family DNA-binding transcriptional regulator [Ignavibacteria bacterium]